MDVQDCIRRVRDGDQSAGRELVEHLYPAVIRIVRCHLPRTMAEEDLCQEVFMKVFSRLDQYQAQVPLDHWVARIAVTTCIDRLRAQKRRPEWRMADFSEEEQAVLEQVNREEPQTDRLDAAAAREVVEKLLARVKPEEAMVIRWMELEDKSIREIQALTGWSAALVKVRAFRARARLRKEWENLNREEKS